MNDLILDKKSEYDEINLYQIFDTLWVNRLKVFLATMLGVIFGFIASTSQSNTEVFINFNLPSSSDFYNYETTNDLINESGFDYIIDATLISDLITTKLNDDLSIIKVIESSEYIDELFNAQEIIKNKKKYNKNILDNFNYIVNSKSNNTKHLLNHSSSNASNSYNILEEIFKGIKQMTKNEIILNLDTFIETIKIRNINQKTKLESDLEELAIDLELKNAQRIAFLKEQSDIANKLDIKDDFYRSQIAKMEANKDVSIRFSQQNMPFYYHGYVAINSEIEVLESKSLENLLLTSDDYLEIKANLSKININKNLSNLIIANKFVKADDMSSWLHYNNDLIKENYTKNNFLIYVAMYGLLALIMISIFIIIISNYEKYKKNSN